MSGLSDEVGVVQGCGWRRRWEGKMLVAREDGQREVCGRMKIWNSALFWVSCSSADLWVSWLDYRVRKNGRVRVQSPFGVVLSCGGGEEFAFAGICADWW